ncbi:hypothetical protein PRIC2_012363 [Phytophthora ramorum]
MIDAMPLEDTEKGFKHSGVAWVRGTLTCFIYTHCAIEQIRLYNPILNLGLSAGLCISIPASILTSALALGLSASICWPLPFASLLMTGPWLGFISFFFLRVRGAHIRANPEAVKEVVRFATITGAQVSNVLIYAGFSTVFTKMPPQYQPVFALLIPVYKVIQKNVTSRLLAGFDDSKPQMVILNIEIFNALFIATCLQNSQSVGTSITLIAVDLLQAAISLLDLHRMVYNVKKTMNKLGVSTNALISTAELVLKKYPAMAGKQRRPDVWAGDSTPRPVTKKQVLPTMNVQVGDCDIPATFCSLAPIDASHDSLSSSVRLGSTAKPTGTSSAGQRTGLNRLTSQEHHRLLKKALQVLFLTEFMLLIEFTEVLVSIIYGGYMVILFYLPNRRYYHQLAHLTHHELWSKVKMNRFSLQQLAFVLEREFFMVQPKLIIWVTMTMQSELPQMGVDYSFEFAWLHQRNNSTETP